MIFCFCTFHMLTWYYISRLYGCSCISIIALEVTNLEFYVYIQVGLLVLPPLLVRVWIEKYTTIVPSRYSFLQWNILLLSSSKSYCRNSRSPFRSPKPIHLCHPISSLCNPMFAHPISFLCNPMSANNFLSLLFSINKWQSLHGH